MRHIFKHQKFEKFTTFKDKKNKGNEKEAILSECDKTRPG